MRLESRGFDWNCRRLSVAYESRSERVFPKSHTVAIVCDTQYRVSVSISNGGVSEDVLRTHRQEIRRGTVVLASLIALREPSYGYALLGSLAEHGIDVDANTLYPLLRRLEDQGLLTSEWNTEETRPRKVYQTSTHGDLVIDVLTNDLADINKAMTSLQSPRGEEQNVEGEQP
ncbi:MAG: helix-turn-helix transcriptional regulator [Actinomycetales bacterium]|nr:helix-turn-helix transcriptional regulator [Actinomycetales bacterium]